MVLPGFGVVGSILHHLKDLDQLLVITYQNLNIFENRVAPDIRLARYLALLVSGQISSGRMEKYWLN